MENWVLCRIFLKKRGGKNEEEPTQIQKKYSKNKVEVESSQFLNCEKINSNTKANKKGVVFYEFLATKGRTDLNLAPVSSLSGSSGVTVISLHEPHEHEQEESSSCNSFSSFIRKP